MKTMNLSEVLAKLEKDPIREFHIEGDEDIRLKVDTWGQLIIHDRMGYSVELEGIYLFEKWVEVEKELSLHTVLRLSAENSSRTFKLVFNDKESSITSTLYGVLEELLVYFSDVEVANALNYGKWYLVG